MRLTKEIQFIFSVERPENSKARNTFLTNSVNVALRNAGFPFKQVVGCYKGKTENSFFILPIRSRVSLGIIREYLERLCIIYDQESYLIIEGRDTYLKLLNKKNRQFIGLWSTVSRRDAIKNKTYTFDPYTGFYHIAL